MTDTRLDEGLIHRRRAAERLLAWGFTPASIARQLHCSVGWVHSVRRARVATHADRDEEYISAEVHVAGRDFDPR